MLKNDWKWHMMGKAHASNCTLGKTSMRWIQGTASWSLKLVGVWTTKCDINSQQNTHSHTYEHSVHNKIYVSHVFEYIYMTYIFNNCFILTSGYNKFNCFFFCKFNAFGHINVDLTYTDFLLLPNYFRIIFLYFSNYFRDYRY